MKKHIFAFAIAVGILIIAISLAVIFRNRLITEEPVPDSLDNPPATLDATATATTPKVERAKSFAERLATGQQALIDVDYAKAAAAFAAAAVEQPTNIEPLLGLAESQIGLRQLARARANLTAAEKLDAVHPQIFILRGIANLREENFSAAETDFQKASEDTAATFWRGLLAAFYDRRAEAEKLLRDSDSVKSAELLAAYDEYARFPDSPKTFLDALLTRAFNQIGEYELAIAKIKPVLAIDPDYRDAWLLLGYAHFARDNYRQAREAWNYAFTLDSAKPETQYFLGLVNLDLNDYAAAEKFLLLAQENRFTTDSLEDNLIKAYFEQDKYHEAVTILREQLERDPAAAIENFTQPIYLYLEQLSDGLSAWKLARQALMRHPENAMAYNLAGWVSLENGFEANAFAYLNRAIQLDSTLPWPHLNLGRYYERVGDRDSALAAYQKTFELDSVGSVGALAAENYNRLLESEAQQ